MAVSRPGRDFFTDCCRGQGFYGGAEIMWLKPFADSFGGVFIDAASANSYLPGWRLWGGYQNRDGLGGRVSWWQWDHASSGRGDVFGTPATATLALTFQKLDLEATQMVSFRRWDLLVGAGVTYVGNTHDTLLQDPVDPSNQEGILGRFDGWGLTTGLFMFRDFPRCQGPSSAVGNKNSRAGAAPRGSRVNAPVDPPAPAGRDGFPPPLTSRRQPALASRAWRRSPSPPATRPSSTRTHSAARRRCAWRCTRTGRGRSRTWARSTSRTRCRRCRRCCTRWRRHRRHRSSTNTSGSRRSCSMHAGNTVFHTPLRHPRPR